MSKKGQQYKMWTKNEFRVLTKIWDTKSMKEIAEELGRNVGQIGAIAHKMRQLGVDLPKKNRKGYLDNLINEFIAESKKK